ncbi:glyoxalase/bleomycin resistance protein/dioxygenase [mine drainage metagenome]|uniref:Glyoxalase/bleomycin resistance protein/dioxygenase n=2 Tax=mine drainage metagenome TaxID=410659 RepID=T1A8F3_9ZZZZ
MEAILTPKLAPYLVARDAPGLIRFIETAIGGRLSGTEVEPDGRIAHAEIRVEDGFVMIGEAPPGRAPFPAMLHVYVRDSDTAYRRALEAGATPVQPPTDRPDGQRRAGVRDRWGNEWWFSSPISKD